MRWHLLIGRLLFGGVLLCAAARHLTGAGLTSALAAQSVPYAPWVALAATVVLALAGASIVLGSFPQVGLRLTVLYLVSAAVLQHAFWTVSDPAVRATELALFLGQVGLLGAAIALLAVPRPWPLSVDAALSYERGARSRGSDRLQLSAAGRWIDAALRGLRRAASRIGPRRLARRSDDVHAIVERPDRGWNRDSAGTIVHMRRAIRTPSGRVLFVQSMRAHFRMPDREYS